MELNFCRRCGEKLHKQSGHIYTCPNKHTIFKNSAPTAGLILLDENDEIVFSVRGIEPCKGMFDLVGGFVDGGETFEQALAREVSEELRLSSDDYTKPKFITSASGTYEYQGETILVITNFYWARLTSDKDIMPINEVAGIHMSKIENIDIEKIAGEDTKACLNLLNNLMVKPWDLRTLSAITK